MITMTLAGTVARFESRLRRTEQQMRLLGAAAVKDQMQSVRAQIVATSPVDTGRLKQSWSPIQVQDDGLTASVSTYLPYAPVLEYGGYKRVGPKTIALGGGVVEELFVVEGGIFSKQAPLGFVRRALGQNAEQFQVRLKNALAHAWGEPLETGIESF